MTVRTIFIRPLCLLTAIVLAVPAQVALLAQEPQLARKQNEWARFQPGAWKKVRVTTETLDERGNISSTSTTDTTTYLDDVTDQAYHLRVEVTVEVAGKKFSAEPQYVVQGYLGEGEGQTPTVRPGEISTVSIEDKRIQCRTFTVEVNGEDQKRITKVYYADKIEPHELRKDSVTTDPTGKNTLYETSESVVAVDMPYKVLADIMSTSVVKTVRKTTKGTTVTLAVHAPGVPGGVVAHSSKEHDATGRIVRRSTLELLDYGLEGEQRFTRRRPFGNRSRRR